MKDNSFYQCYNCGVYTRGEPGDTLGLDEIDGVVEEIKVCHRCADEEGYDAGMHKLNLLNDFCEDDNG